MRKARILLILGIWIAILPYLGFPLSWKDILATLSGLLLIYISYTFYIDFKKKEVLKKSFDNFSENHDFKEKEDITMNNTEGQQENIN